MKFGNDASKQVTAPLAAVLHANYVQKPSGNRYKDSQR